MNYSNISDEELNKNIKFIEEIIDTEVIRLGEMKEELKKRKNKPINGDIYMYSGHMFIVRYYEHADNFYSIDEYGVEVDNTRIYKKYFPDGDWKRVGNVFTMLKK